MQQGQRQRHLHLVHGKLLPDAVPAEKWSSSADSTPVESAQGKGKDWEEG